MFSCTVLWILLGMVCSLVITILEILILLPFRISQFLEDFTLVYGACDCRIKNLLAV